MRARTGTCSRLGAFTKSDRSLKVNGKQTHGSYLMVNLGSAATFGEEL